MSFRKKRSLAAPKGLFGFSSLEAGTQQKRRAQKDEQDREVLRRRQHGKQHAAVVVPQKLDEKAKYAI